MKSNQNKANRTEENDEENNNFRSEEVRHEEPFIYSETEIVPIVEPIPNFGDIAVFDNDRSRMEHLPEEEKRSTEKQIEPNSTSLNDTPSLQSGDSAMGIIILGILLIVLGVAVSAFIFALGGELLGLLGAIGIIPGVIALYIGLRRRNNKSRVKKSVHQGGKINLFALFAWILLPVCFLGVLGIIAGPILLAFLIIATIQFKRNPGKYKGKWMVDVFWILIITAAIVYLTTALLVLLFW